MTDNAYEAKEWLNRMFKAWQDVDATRRTLETILAEMGGVARYSQEFTGHNPRASEERLARYSTVAAELERKQRDLDAEDIRTEQIINKLKDFRHRAILRDRYINRLSWRNISNKLHFSEPRLFELHRDALEQIWQYIPGRNGNI